MGGRGVIATKSAEFLWRIIETCSENSKNHGSFSRIIPTSSFEERSPKPLLALPPPPSSSSSSELLADVENLSKIFDKVDDFSNRFDKFLNLQSTNSISQTPQGFCTTCGASTHSSSECPHLGADEAQKIVNTMNQRSLNNPYSQSYNLGWWQHPNVAWGGNPSNSIPNSNQARPPPNSKYFHQGFKPQLQNQSFHGQGQMIIPNTQPPQLVSPQVVAASSDIKANTTTNTQNINSHSQFIANSEVQIGELVE